ncbi:hypothetical protein ACN47E_000997 [Coniothyrium glycines]
MEPTSTSILDLGQKGSLKGSIFQNGVKRFTHIPFAQAPTGALRWQKPVPLPADYVYCTDNGPLDCTKYGNDYNFDEDCLAVNVWVPAGDAPDSGWPILAWIHGGWLQIGDPALKEHAQPTQLIAEGGLKAIVIAIGYRLNIFGFLAGEGLKGNFGFWDQRCGLEWIQDHAKLLGGDPDRVTLGGLSAGAFSTQVQLNFELSQPQGSRALFSNVWLQSNAIPAQPKTLKEVDAQLQNVYETFGIDKSLSTSEKLDHLRKVPASDLVSKLFDLEVHTFRGVTDDEIIPSDLITSIHSGVFAARFKDRGMRILLGEAEAEEVLYGLTNPPPSSSDKDMLRALVNYYAQPVCERLLELYTAKGSAYDPRVADALALSDDSEKAKTLFGIITSDVQVRAPIRVLSKALYRGGVPPERILRYRVAYRSDCADKAYPRSYGVTHGVDGINWWFVERYGFSDEEAKNVKKWLAITLLPLVTGEGSTKDELAEKQFLYFRETGDIEVRDDCQWGWLMQVADTLAA